MTYIDARHLTTIKHLIGNGVYNRPSMYDITFVLVVISLNTYRFSEHFCSFKRLTSFGVLPGGFLLLVLDLLLDLGLLVELVEVGHD